MTTHDPPSTIPTDPEGFERWKQAKLLTDPTFKYGYDLARKELNALVTDGHNIEVRLCAALGELESAVREDWSEIVRERVFDLLSAGRMALYEWDKRARRARMDWWHR